MQYNDYIIAIDENGQPYIAHSWANRWKNYKHKYLEKVHTKSGLWRYLYTPEEVAAFRRERKLNRNRNNVSSQELASAHNAANAARSRVRGNRQEAARNAKKKAVKAVDDIGIDDAIRYAKAKKRGVKSTEDLQKYQSAQYQWKNSKLGKASKTIRDNANKTLSSIRNADVKGAAKSLGKKIDDLGIDEYYRYLRANKNKNMSGQQKAQYQREWQESTIGKRITKRKRKN